MNLEPQEVRILRYSVFNKDFADTHICRTHIVPEPQDETLNLEPEVLAVGNLSVVLRTFVIFRGEKFVLKKVKTGYHNCVVALVFEGNGKELKFYTDILTDFGKTQEDIKQYIPKPRGPFSDYY